jgi:hypothetical protein
MARRFFLQRYNFLFLKYLFFIIIINIVIIIIINFGALHFSKKYSVFQIFYTKIFQISGRIDILNRLKTMEAYILSNNRALSLPLDSLEMLLLKTILLILLSTIILLSDEVYKVKKIHVYFNLKKIHVFLSWTYTWKAVEGTLQ